MDLGSLTGILLSTLLSTLLSGGAQTTPTTQAVLQAFNDVKITSTTMVAAESEQETAAESVDLIAVINENVQEEVTETAPVIVVADVAVENQILNTAAPAVEETTVVETTTEEYAPVVEETTVVEEAPVVEEPAIEAPTVEAPVVEEAPVIEEVVIPEIPEEPYYEETVVETPNYTTTWNGQALTAWAGVIDGPNGKETYYNLDMSGVVSIMQGLGYDYEYWVRDDGVKMYGDYVMVAADLDLRPRGSIYETSLGYGIVCDTGSFAYSDPYQTDIAVNW